MQGIIYKLTSPSGKIYIGQTVQSLKNRLSGHKTDCINRTSPITSAIRKYGLENFFIETLITVQSEREILNNQLNKLEIFYIKLYNSYENGYNATTGGGKNCTISESTRKKFSIIAKNRKYSPETIEKFRQSHIRIGGRKTLQLDKYGNILQEFSSVRQASLITGVHITNIFACCSNLPNRLTAGGFKWKFKDANLKTD